MTHRIHHIDPSQLPRDWVEPLGLAPGQQVSVSIEPEVPKKRFHRAGIEAAVREIRALPVLDDRSADEIIGYDVFGLPK